MNETEKIFCDLNFNDSSISKDHLLHTKRIIEKLRRVYCEKKYCQNKTRRKGRNKFPKTYSQVLHKSMILTQAKQINFPLMLIVDLL